MNSGFYERCEELEDIIKTLDFDYEESNVIDGCVKFYRYNNGFVSIIAQISISSSNIKLFTPAVDSYNACYVNSAGMEKIRKGSPDSKGCIYEYGKEDVNYRKFYMNNREDNTLFIAYNTSIHNLTLASEKISNAYWAAKDVVSECRANRIL